ncbi:hypothetical protein HZI73_00445 [Vallitalea pronyensis]|uniref:Uncharacterized protein n=1 Tax=Vallitalea pronyensis TaxID=1348613 RepID=A0A8J8MFY0_9FIRM|nr:hypothetical protein [Vallitalea pronyensis]QUI20869.1 hypothetical protein HZI73_00445 [Vallitalea pronyensis]
MEKYKNPFEIYRPYNMYEDNEENFGYGNYGYNGGFNQNPNQNPNQNQNRYPKPRYDQYNQNRLHNKPMKVPVQMPKEDQQGMHEWDRKKLKALYPEVCKRIQYYVEEICDTMDHSSSYMYDEYPEREVIEMTIDKIYEKVEKDDDIMNEFRENMDDRPYNHRVNNSPKYGRKPYRWLRHLIQVLLLNEICGRRRKRSKRKSRRPLYHKPQPYYYRYPNFFE